MKTTIELNKDDFPSPGEIGATIKAMETRASMSTYYSHPTIDDAVVKLKQFRDLMRTLYVNELGEVDRRMRRRLKIGEDYVEVEEKDS